MVPVMLAAACVLLGSGHTTVSAEECQTLLQVIEGLPTELSTFTDVVKVCSNAMCDLMFSYVHSREFSPRKHETRW